MNFGNTGLSATLDRIALEDEVQAYESERFAAVLNHPLGRANLDQALHLLTTTKLESDSILERIGGNHGAASIGNEKAPEKAAESDKALSANTLASLDREAIYRAVSGRTDTPQSNDGQSAPASSIEDIDRDAIYDRVMRGV